LIVVLSDRSLSLIRVSEERRGFPAYGVDFTPARFRGRRAGLSEIAGRRVRQQ